MTMTVCCPPPTAIASVVTTLNPCPQTLGQIDKVIFWRRGNYMSVASASVSTAWTTRFESTGTDKAVASPFLGNVEMPVPDPREFGGGNETVRGASIRRGNLSTKFSGRIYQADQDTIAYLKDLMCETLDVLFFNEANEIIYREVGTDCYGFPVTKGSLFLSDKHIGGLEEADYNILSFNLRPNWSNSLKIVS